MRRLLVLLLALCLVSPCFAQGSAELDALLDTFFAKDLKTVLQHLPPELADAFAKASPHARQVVARRLMFRQELEKEGTKFTRPESGALLIVEPPVHGEEEEKECIEISLARKMSDGNETMLQFRMKSVRDEASSPRNSAAIVWMRYVDGEWRIYEIEGDGQSIKFDDPQFLASLTGGEGGHPPANEASAVGSLRTLNTAMVVYASTYPDIGFPSSISMLAGDGNSPDHGGLIDPVLGTPPHEKSGYRFTYISDGGSPNTTYKIMARPVEYGVTGTRNFFTDQSGVIRCTKEDREPTEEDPPLQ